MKEIHAEETHSPGDHSVDDDAYDNRKVATGYGREDLTANDTVKQAISYHNNHQEKRSDLVRVVTHKPARYNL